MSPFDLANWLRRVPSKRLPENVRRRVAWHVMEHSIDGQTFEDVIDGRLPWIVLGVQDRKIAAALAKLFETKRKEDVLAEAAYENGAKNLIDWRPHHHAEKHHSHFKPHTSPELK